MITGQERVEVLGWLDESRREFLAAIDGVSNEQWSWKPAPERWSVAECAEHIVLAEQVIFGIALRALAAPPNPDCEEQTRGKTEFIVRVMAPRQGVAQAPEAIRPRSAPERREIEQRFETQRVDICKFAAETRLDLRSHTADHPFPVFGALNAYQWLIYVPLHSLRHVKQIAEVKAAAGYP